MRQFFIAGFMLACSVLSFGQHYVKGSVTDENGNALFGANVFIKSESKGKTTDKNGSFLFENLSNLQYSMEISFVGYDTRVLDVKVDQPITIALLPTAYSLGEITVNSIRANNLSAIAYSDMKAVDIEKRNSGQDIPYLLALTPSFITTSDAGTGIGYTGFRIRGTDANRTNITVNGVPLNDAESHGTFFVNMPDFASSLSSVQVQRGVGTSTNGAAAFGASINMQTENFNTKPYAEVNSTIGSFNTNKNTVKVGSGSLNSGFSFDARLSNVTSDGYVDRAWVDLKSYYFSSTYVHDKTRLKFLTFGGNEITYQAWYGVDKQTMATNRTFNEAGKYIDNNGIQKFYDNQTDNYNQRHYQLHWLQQLNDQLSMNISAHLTRGKGFYEEYKEGRKFREYGLIPDTIAGNARKKTDLVRQKWLDNYFYGITYAFDYKRDKLNISVGGAVNRYDGNHFGKVIWARYANNLDIAKEWYRSKGIKDDANIYAKINAEIISNLYISGDVQYRYILYRMLGKDDKYDYLANGMRDITQEHEFHFLNPKLGLTYKINSLQDIYASFSVSNREPNRNNYTERALNESLPKPETLFDTEAGYRLQSSKWTGGANLYFMKYKNQLILTGKLSEIGEALTSNIDDSYRAGVELSSAVKFSSWFNWNANLTLSQNKINNFIETIPIYNSDYDLIDNNSENIGKTNIAFSPSIIANNVFGFTFNKFELGVHSNFVGRQFLDNTYTTVRSIDPYFVNNLSFRYSLPLQKIKTIDFQLLLNNVLNHQYESNGSVYSEYYEGDASRYDYVGYYPQAGINFLASVAIKF